MGKKRFVVRLEGEAVIELDDAVIDAVDDEWRSYFYQLYTPEEIAGHIVYNLVINQWSPPSLAGWADQPDENARIVEDAIWDIWAYLADDEGEPLRTLRR